MQFNEFLHSYIYTCKMYHVHVYMYMYVSWLKDVLGSQHQAATEKMC